MVLSSVDWPIINKKSYFQVKTKWFFFVPFDMKMVFDQKKRQKRQKTKPFFFFFFVYKTKIDFFWSKMKNDFVFSFFFCFFFRVLRLSVTKTTFFALTVFHYRSFTKNYLPILTLSYLHLFPKINSFYHQHTLYDTFYQVTHLSHAHTDFTLSFTFFIEKHTVRRYNTTNVTFILWGSTSSTTRGLKPSAWSDQFLEIWGRCHKFLGFT